MHSTNFNKIKSYYDEGLWSIAKVRAVVNKRLGITPEEFFEITGQEY